jgi:HK97 family phage major capsid protein
MASAPVGHPAPFPWATHDWSSVLLTKLAVESVLLSSGASFFPVTGSSLTIPRLTVDADAAAWLDPGEEFPTDDVQGDSVTLSPKKLGIVTGIDVEAIEDADVATLDVIGDSLARAIATKLDARIFSTAAADKGPAGLLGTFSTLAKAVSVTAILEAVATVQSRGGVPNTIWVNPADYVALRLEPVESGGKLPLLGVDASAVGNKTVDGIAIRMCPALAAGKAVVGEARQIIVGIGRQISVAASSEARFTSDVVLVKASIRAYFKVNDPQGIVLVGT